MTQEMAGGQLNWSASICQDHQYECSGNGTIGQEERFANSVQAQALDLGASQAAHKSSLEMQYQSLAHMQQPLTSFAANYLIEPLQSFEYKLNYYFQDIWQATGDERTNRLPFIGAGPWKLLYATLAYLYLIKWLLPRLMRSHKALELNWIIRVYNLLMVLSNIWAFYHGARILSFGLKCFGCENINHGDYSPPAIELLHYGWLFFVSRLVEWLDTIFFVLRKKDKQVTKLHVFHHSFVPLISWTYLKYHPGYSVAFFPFVNTFVHSIMYTYYLLATFGTKLQPYLWWKRYLTSLQIAQFVLILLQLASIPLTVSETCQYPRGFLYVAFAGAILFLWLFYTYYIETYHYQTTTTTKQRAQQANGGRQKSVTTVNNEEANSVKKLEATSRKPREPTMKQVIEYSRLSAGQREGSSRALADAIENAIGSFCELSGRTSETISKEKKKIV